MQLLELLGTYPGNLSMPLVLHHVGFKFLCVVSSEENAIYATIRSLFDLRPRHDQGRTFNIWHMHRMRDDVLSVINDGHFVDVVDAEMKKIVRQAFDSDTGGHIRLCRFGTLRGMVLDSAADFIRSQPEFLTDATTTLVNLCSTSRGEPLDVDRVCRAMADCVIEMFVKFANFLSFRPGQHLITGISLSEDCEDERAAYLQELAQIDKGLEALDRIKDL